MFDNIKDALDYLYSFVNLEQDLTKKSNRYSLDSVLNIIGYFNNPHNGKKIIHIAGTKGKGSVSLFISKMLNMLGYSVATFLSPHLIKPNERILFNLIEITDKELVEMINRVKEVIERHKLKPTTFEIFFIIYLLYADSKKAKYLVIETGLGGRLDCTNIVTPIVSVITSISFDHTEILGETIEEIATEKAFIIKNNSKVVISKQRYNCEHVFKNRAIQSGSKIFFVSRYFKIKNIKHKKNGNTFDIVFENIKEINIIFKDKMMINNFYLSLFGKHQIENFLTAFLTVFIIKPEIFGLLTKIKTIDLKIKGRIETIKDNPLTIVDVSHNEDSITKLVETLKKHFGIKKFVILIALASDKDYRKIYSTIKSIATQIIITDLCYKKSEPERDFEYVKNIFKNTILIKNQNEAINYAIKLNKPLLVTGSFYLAGPFLEEYDRILKK
ncbi:MAG TPA: Mur ligase family protein [Spirochaetota bacterium]|nr:Mur ligase family protein [Spirochaetota bacterium]HOL56405.1 Mur ligase family protein [Spirochaetota bacterium]HPP03889.1 Mur ligase family protein [Spirochaetota bacterium]